jgi:uncharacterized membrane protein YgcG
MRRASTTSTNSFWPLLTIATFLLASGVRADEGWTIERFDIRYAIQGDGTVQVHEAVDVDFRGLSKHGILRDIVYLLEYDQTNNREYDIDLGSVTNAAGSRLNVKTTSEGNLRRFRIGDANIEVSGNQSYRIDYELRGALNGFPDHDELYWNASGTWPVPVEVLRVTVTAPSGAIERVSCFQGFSGSTEPCDARHTPDEATFSATRALSSGEQMTIVTAIRKGVVASPAPILVRRARDITQFFDWTPGFLSATAAGFLAAFGGIGALWWRVGRDRRYVSLHYLAQDTKEERVPLFRSDPIVVEFEPPDRMRPGQMGLLIDERADTLDVTATIVDLAVRGYLTIKELPKEGWGWFSNTDWELTRSKPADAELLEYERVILDGLFDAGSSRKLSDLKNKFYEDLAQAKRALYADAVSRGWFPRNPNTVRNVVRGLGYASAVGGVFLMFLLGRRWGAGLVALPVIAGGLVLAMISRAMPRRAAAGREALRRALGFARYIKTAETTQQAFAERANIFTSYLPYAIVFKCVDKWARAFSDIDVQKATASWNTGTSRFDSGTFSSNLAGFSSSVSNTIASTPGGSGGSGFSGGSSGGGGGGGGGGSW